MDCTKRFLFEAGCWHGPVLSPAPVRPAQQLLRPAAGLPTGGRSSGPTPLAPAATWVAARKECADLMMGSKSGETHGGEGQGGASPAIGRCRAHCRLPRQGEGGKKNKQKNGEV